VASVVHDWPAIDARDDGRDRRRRPARDESHGRQPADGGRGGGARACTVRYDRHPANPERHRPVERVRGITPRHRV